MREKNISRKTLIQLAGYSESYIDVIINGTVKITFRAPVIKKIANILGVKIDELFVIGYCQNDKCNTPLYPQSNNYVHVNRKYCELHSKNTTLKPKINKRIIKTKNRRIESMCWSCGYTFFHTPQKKYTHYCEFCLRDCTGNTFKNQAIEFKSKQANQ